MEKLIAKAPWFEAWFDSAYYHQLYAHRNHTEAGDFINRLVERLCPLPYSAMLDLGCGCGRHSRQLAGKGFRVLGLDLSDNSIQEAKAVGTANASFHRHDMRAPFGTGRFDYVFNFFTSFGYFKSREENRAVVKNIAASLKRYGIAVVDYLNVQAALKTLVPFEKTEKNGVRYFIRRWADAAFIYKRIRIYDPVLSSPLTFTEQVGLFTLTDFETLFREQGLRLESVYGDYNLNSYEPPTSKRLIMIFRKAAC